MSKNVTLRMDEDLLKAFRHKAVDSGLSLSAWIVVDNSLSLFRSGLIEQERWKLSLWDSMILAAARKAGAPRLYTEDLNNGQDYGGVVAINPFNPSSGESVN